MTERKEIVVKIKGCPLGLEGQAWLIKTYKDTYTVSHEHCYEGNVLLTHYLTENGKYLRTEGCENCKLKANGKTSE